MVPIGPVESVKIFQGRGVFSIDVSCRHTVTLNNFCVQCTGFIPKQLKNVNNVFIAHPRWLVQKDLFLKYILLQKFPNGIIIF